VLQVYAIAEAIKPWYRALVLTAAMTGVRWGELVALRRRHLDLEGAFVDVRSAVVEDETGLTVDRTKSDPGSVWSAFPRCSCRSFEATSRGGPRRDRTVGCSWGRRG
jgi:integrase